MNTHHSPLMIPLASVVLSLALVAGCNSSGDSGPSGSDSDDSGTTPPALGSPSNLEALESIGGIVIAWDEGDNAQAHNLYAATEYGFTLENYAAYDGGTLYPDAVAPFAADTLAPARVWHFALTAEDEDGNESDEAARLSVVGNYAQGQQDNATIVDALTGLEWARCSVGQSWNADAAQCDGEPTRHTESEAEQYDTPDADGWRSPDIDELLTLVFCPEYMDLYQPDNFTANCSGEDRQEHASIYHAAFPNTEARGYYSSSRGVTSSGNVYTKTVVFSTGSESGVYVPGGDYSLNLRLVRESDGG